MNRDQSIDTEAPLAAAATAATAATATTTSTTTTTTATTQHRLALLQSQYRAFTKQRIARRKAGGGNEANSERGLAALDFVNHDLPQLDNTDVLKKVLLSDLPLGYHTRDGINSFHIAASRSNEKIIHKLLNSHTISKVPIKSQARAHKINPRKRTRDGMSALHFCASAEADNVDVCKLVLEIMLESHHKYDGTSSHMFTELNLSDVPDVSTPRERLICELLLQKTKKVGLNVLGLCCLSANAKVLQFLLNQIIESPKDIGMYVLQQNITSRNHTFLHIAAYNCDLDMLKIFQSMGIEFHPYFVKDHDGRNPIHHLAMSKHASSVLHEETYELLKQEYFVHVQKGQGRGGDGDGGDDGEGPGAPSSTPAKTLLEEMLRQTTNKGETPLHLACNSGASGLARLLWKDGSRWDARDSHGNTPFVLLLRHRFKSSNIMKLLKEIIKASPHSWFDHSVHRKTGRSALIRACEWRNLKALKIMLNHLPSKQCLNYVDAGGKTPLHYCSETSFVGGLKLLLETISGDDGGGGGGGGDGGGGVTSEIAEKHSLHQNNPESSGGDGSHVNLSRVLSLQDNDGCTPLMSAIGSSDATAVEIILKAIIKMDCQNMERQEVLPQLIHVIEPESEPEPEQTTNDPQKNDIQQEETTTPQDDHIPLNRLPPLESPPVLPLLFEQHDNAPPIPATNYLLLCKQLVEYQNSDGLSPLQIAALLPDATIIKLLLEASVLCECSQYVASSLTKEENNVLHCSAAGGSVATILTLVEFDYNLASHLSKQKNYKNKRPSDLAKYWKHHDVCEMLLHLEHNTYDKSTCRMEGVVESEEPVL